MGSKRVNPAVRIIVAGYPKDDIEKLKASGVDDFIHVRTNVLETLEQIPGATWNLSIKLSQPPTVMRPTFKESGE